jgi:hypothetical protein
MASSSTHNPIPPDRSKSAPNEVAEKMYEAKPWAVALARWGHVSKGIVYIIIGVLAFGAAFGVGGRTTDSNGALHTIAEQPFGRVLLGLVGVGLLGYALWRFAEAALDPENKGSDAKGIGQRFGYAFSGFVYGSLAFTAFRIVLHVTGGNQTSQQDWTATLLARPFGQWLVAIVGLITIGTGISALAKAFTAKFREHLKIGEMDHDKEVWVTRLGRIGYGARGVVLSIIGVFFLNAARQANPQKSGGLDEALDALARQTYGPWLLGTVAVGLIAYGLYAVAEARYRKI